MGSVCIHIALRHWTCHIRGLLPMIKIVSTWFEARRIYIYITTKKHVWLRGSRRADAPQLYLANYFGSTCKCNASKETARQSWKGMTVAATGKGLAWNILNHRRAVATARSQGIYCKCTFWGTYRCQWFERSHVWQCVKSQIMLI